MELRRLRECFENGPVVSMRGYPYFVSPPSDGVPRIDRDLLEEIVDGLVGIADLDCDLILAPEAMGIPVATALTMRTGIPFAIIRKKAYGLPGEIVLDQTTGYSKSTMYIETVEPGERVALVDDTVDTGGTVRAVVSALRGRGVVVTEVLAVYDRSPDVSALSEEIGVPVRCLLRVDARDGRPVVRE